MGIGGRLKCLRERRKVAVTRTRRRLSPSIGLPLVQQLFDDHLGSAFRTLRQVVHGKINDFRVSATEAENLQRFHFAAFHETIPPPLV